MYEKPCYNEINDSIERGPHKSLLVPEETLMKNAFRTGILLIILLLLPVLPYMSFASAETDGNEATDLTRYLVVEQSRGHNKAQEKVNDSLLGDTFPYHAFETVRLSWENAPQKPAFLCVQWGVPPEQVELRQFDKDGVLLSEDIAASVFDAIIPLAEDTVSVMITAGSAGMDFARLALFSEGSLPAPFFDWKDTPHGMDYLLISTHPDDDTLFMGGIIPTYGAEMGYVGTVAYVTNPSRIRINEAMLAAREMGTQYRPIVIGFQDVRNDIRDGYEDRFLPEVVTRALVRLLREYRPLVVFTHDLNGEYGHWQHIIVAASVAEACRLSADPTFDPISYEQFGTWEVRKCYLHLYPDNPLVMDIHTPLSSRGGRTAFEVAQAAYKKHQTQQNGNHECEDANDSFAMNRYGMIYGTVEAGNDVFDNIDPALFASCIPSEQTPEPSPEPTPAPTSALTPEPTQESATEPTSVPSQEPATVSVSEPTSVPSQVPVAEPAPTSAPEPIKGAAGSDTKNVLLLCILIGAAVVLGVTLLIFRKRR